MLQRRKCECGSVWSSLLHHVQSLRQQENQHYDDDQGPYSQHRLCGLYILRKHTDSVPFIYVAKTSPSFFLCQFSSTFIYNSQL